MAMSRLRFREAIKAAYNAGVTVVVAAGNDPSVEVKDQVPSGFSEVIAVASTTADDGNTSGCPFYEGTTRADTASDFTTDRAPARYLRPSNYSASRTRTT
jgi:subtilisin family serine protease